MKKIFLLLTLIFSLSVTLLCLADETKEADAKTFQASGIRNDEAGTQKITTSELQDQEISGMPSRDEGTNAIVGSWVQKKTDGRWLALPGPTYNYYIYPDGTVANSDGSLVLPVSFEDDGKFTIDTSGVEDLADYTVTGQVTPLSQESLDRFNVDVNTRSDICPENNNQLILTISYPDPLNPLAGSPAVTYVYFLRNVNQDTFLKNYMSGKIWKSGDNILEIDQDGVMNLNKGAYTGTFAVYNNNDSSLYIPAKVRLRWDDAGTVLYEPTLVSSEKIHLQNIDNPEEILVFEYVQELEKHDPEEETSGCSEPDENARPFIGKWEITQVLKDGVEIDASELLETDSMSAEITESGSLSLKFSGGFNASLNPVYEGNTLKVKYDKLGYNMDWTAQLDGDDTATAEYNGYRIKFERIH